MFWEKIKQLGRDRNKRNELQEHCLGNVDKILNSISTKVLTNDGVDLLNYTLNGIPDTPAAVAKHKFKVMEIVFKTLAKETTSAVHSTKLVSRICTELPKLSTANVVKICEYCIQTILTDGDINTIWKDVLPECLRILKEKTTVISGTTEMTPPEYIKQVVNTLMHGKFTHPVLLAAMFRDIQLEKPEHEMVVSKLCSCMNERSPEDLPPLVHQLLKLTKTQNMEIVLAYMSNYFNTRLYNKLEQPLQDSDGTNFELEDFVTTYTPAELTSCMCTSVYHAKELSSFVTKKIATTPKSLVITQPLIVRLALTMSELGPDFKETCIGAIKSAIQQECILEQKMKESAWLRSLIKSDADITRLLKIIVAECASNPELITFGLVNLAFSLLSTSPLLGRENLALQCWYYGKLIIVRLVRSQPVIASHVLKILADKMACDANIYNQCAELTQLLCKYAPLCLMEGMAQINALMESTIWGAGANIYGCANTVKAAARAGAASSRLRDVQILLCRKGLFHRDIRIRCNALAGLVNVLKSLKVNSRGQASLSENSSAHSYLTQISLQGTQLGTQVSSYVHNETVCLEVISMLRRCLKQDAVVKQILYSEIHECVLDKPAPIQLSALELLTDHFPKFYTEGNSNDSDTTMRDGSGIVFENCIQTNVLGASLIEPIGHLIYALSKFCITLTSEIDSEESTLTQGAIHTGSTLQKTLDSLARSQIAINESDTSINEQSLETQTKVLKHQQKLQCIEALMAYKINSWNPNSTENAAIVYNLFKSYNQIMENTKVSKSLKKTSKLNETGKETQKSQKNQKSTSSNKEKAVVFKPLPCLWDLSVCARVCELLYGEDVVWSSLEQRNQIRTKRDFHHFVHLCIRSCLTESNHSKEHITEHCRNIALILFRRCLVRFEDLCDFDEITAFNCLETFKECILLVSIPHHHINVKQFLRDITNQQDGDSSECVAAILSALKSALESQDMDAEDSAEIKEDSLTKKITSAIFGLIHIIYHKLSPAPSTELTNILKWYEQLIRTKSRDYLGLLPTLLTANCSSTFDTTLVNDILAALKEILGSVNDEEENVERASEIIPALTQSNSSTVAVNVCVTLCAWMTHVNHALLRIKNATSSLSYVTHGDKERLSKQIRNIERGVIVGLHIITSCCISLMECRVKIGVASQRILSAVLKLYTALVGLTRIAVRHTANDLYTIRFEKLLKVSGKKLSTALDNFITYVESMQCDESRGKVTAAQILRDTQLIPRVVCQAELYYKQIITIANKCKVNFQQYLSHGTARDFRLNAAVMKEALSHHQQDISMDEEEPEKENELDALGSENDEREVDVEDEEVHRGHKRRNSDQSDIENISPNKRTR